MAQESPRAIAMKARFSFSCFEIRRRLFPTNGFVAGPESAQSPFSKSERFVPRAVATFLSVRKPGSRVPRSKSEMWTSWTPECSARSICRQPLARRSFLMRSPVAAQMSFAIRP